VTVRVNPDGEIGSAMQLQGTVESLEFLGATVRYTVKVGGSTVLADENHQRGKKIYKVTDAVRLVVPEKQVLFVEG